MYAELICRSNHSFLKGASHPEELVTTAAGLGLHALALTDDDGLYGAVKAHLVARQVGLKLVLGSALSLTDGPPVVVHVACAKGYANLCRLISQGRMAAEKGKAGIPWRALAERGEGLFVLLPAPWPRARVEPLAEAFPGRFSIGLTRTLSATDDGQVERARALARGLRVPVCAHGDVHTHVRERQALQDVLTAIRHKTTVAQCGRRLFPNAERTLRAPRELAALFANCPEALARGVEIADACRFTLEELKYEFSDELLPPGLTRSAYLRELTYEGLRARYPAGVPASVQRQIDHELGLIEQLKFEGYFLSLWDIVRFARERGILCQGRGSAANSAVCYALQLTAIDPVRMGLLFERFMSMERKEPPDIDVDFEHERREEVLQYVYEKHGRERAAMVCEVICYRGRLAAREVGKALGLSLDQVDRLAKVAGHDGLAGAGLDRLREAGLSPEDPKLKKAVRLAQLLEGTPRHLSIHVGGFVITRGPLVELVPVENAAMPGRTVVQWEKDDVNAVGILKVDLLALGMLSAIRKAFALVQAHEGVELSMATVPPEDPRVYEMICQADTIGVFQIESRAQMNMLPRLKPRTFYDLVIEIALIRPGPIIGDMVHPYLRRRDGLEEVTYPSEAVRAILEKTLGVPLFQEQAMKLAMVAAGFSAAEADGLRRILSHKRAPELLAPFQARFIEGCVARGYPRAFAEGCFKQFEGFAHYGFPESHSASFALIAYASAYLKYHHPAAFTAAILNSQPMGFYAPHTLVEDARRHGVETRPLDVNHSDWDCTLEPAVRALTQKRPPPTMGAFEAQMGEGGPALRLGLRLVKGMKEASARRISERRGEGYASIGELARRAGLPRHELTRLALAGALRSLAASRREVLWEIQALGPFDEDDLFYGLPMDQTQVALPEMNAKDRTVLDYQTTGLSLEHHPLALLRPALKEARALTAVELGRARAGRRASVGGLVIVRQRPQTAKGFCFISLEDETGIANLVIEPARFEQYRKEIMSAVLLLAEGRVERSGRVVNLKVAALAPLSLEAVPDDRLPSPRSFH